MDIFQFAMEKEKSSEDYYRRMAGRAGSKGLRNICNMLAVEESKHYNIVEQMSKKIPVKVTQAPVLDNARKIFEKMRDSADKFNFDIGELELYQKALDIEKESREFYLEKAELVEDTCQQGIFKKLANEEQKHYILLDNICDFVARPRSYLENAEFNHIQDYADGIF